MKKKLHHVFLAVVIIIAAVLGAICGRLLLDNII